MISRTISAGPPRLQKSGTVTSSTSRPSASSAARRGLLSCKRPRRCFSDGKKPAMVISSSAASSSRPLGGPAGATAAWAAGACTPPRRRRTRRRGGDGGSGGAAKRGRRPVAALMRWATMIDSSCNDPSIKIDTIGVQSPPRIHRSPARCSSSTRRRTSVAYISTPRLLWRDDRKASSSGHCNGSCSAADGCSSRARHVGLRATWSHT